MLFSQKRQSRQSVILGTAHHDSDEYQFHQRQYNYETHHHERFRPQPAHHPYAHPPSVTRRVSQPMLLPSGRKSLSALDERRAEELRKGAFTYTSSRAAVPVTSHAPPVLVQQKQKQHQLPPRRQQSLQREQPNNARDSAHTVVRPRTAPHRRVQSASATSRSNGYDARLLRPPPRANSFMTGQTGQQFYGVPKEFYPMQEQSMIDFVTRTERSLANWSTPKTTIPRTYTPLVDNTNFVDAYPMLLNRPRKLSSSTTATSVSRPTSRDSMGSGMRSSSWGSRTSFESMDSGVLKGQAHRWPSYQRPAPIKALRKSRPGEMFATIPGEVLELILDELKKLHLGQEADSCATCWMRDLCSISLTSRKWYKFARTSLYEDVQIVGADSAAMKKRYKGSLCPRLVLLRRTLRASQQIAVIVHSLKVPQVPEGIPVEKYHDLVASVVMACPNLERLLGLHPRYNHSFDRLFHALSTRTRLKQMDWIIDAVPPNTPPMSRPSSKHANKAALSTANAPRLTPGDISPAQSTAFLDHHFNWTHLTSLSIHSLPGGTVTPDNLIPTAISYLPSLQHLFLSRLPFTAFKDNGLLSLPPLKTLSLSHLPGITSNGLSAFATRSESQGLIRLILRHINLDEMPTLARVLSNLTRLESFAFVQSFPPMMPEDNAIWLMPYLASASLKKIHWDITSHPHCANSADNLLTRSIAANGFPSLRSLRAPNDPEGLFQALCKPRERCDTPLDRFRGSLMPQHGRTPSVPGRSLSMPSSPTRLTVKKTPTSPMLPPYAGAHGEGTTRSATDLGQARLAAQARLEAARRFPRYFATVVDEHGMLVDKFGLAGFLGTPESRVVYDLQPDAGATDAGGGLVGVDDVTGDCGETALGSEGCSGRWNVPDGPVDKKDKDKDRWWHTERGRWRNVRL